jgi:hypothetical protein
MMRFRCLIIRAFHKNGVSVFHSQKMEHYGFFKKITAGGFSIFMENQKIGTPHLLQSDVLAALSIYRNLSIVTKLLPRFWRAYTLFLR